MERTSRIGFVGEGQYEMGTFVGDVCGLGLCTLTDDRSGTRQEA